MNFEKSVFYALNEGAGTSVADTLGNGPAGAIQGAMTNLWATADCLTVSNAAGAEGDNAIRLSNSYIDAMMRMDDLNGSLVFMHWLKQPQVPSSGFRMMYGYGDISSATDGAYAIGDAGQSIVYSIRSGAINVFDGITTVEPITAAENNTWFAYGCQIDVIDGQVIVNGYLNGHALRGLRLFDLESALPRVSSNGTGLRLLAGCAGATGSTNFMWGQTQVKRAFVGRVSGDQRHNIPKWMKQFYDTTSGTPAFMVS